MAKKIPYSSINCYIDGHVLNKTEEISLNKKILIVKFNTVILSIITRFTNL